MPIYFKNLTVEQLKEACERAHSIAGVLAQFGLRPSGGAYQSFHRMVADHEVDVTHFTGEGHLKGKTHNWNTKIPLEDIFDGKHPGFSRHSLKKRLKSELGWEHKCQSCGGEEWMGQPIPIQLDHINGIFDDHRLENLRFLCPNCHSLTETFAGRNVGRRPATSWAKTEKPVVVDEPKERKRRTIQCHPCATCGKDTRRRQTYCSYECSNAGQRKCELDANEIMEVLVECGMNYSKAARKIGISDNGIKKRLKRAGLV